MNIRYSDSYCELLGYFDRHVILSEECKDYLAKVLVQRSFPARHVILQPQTVCSRLYFVQSGNLMRYFRQIDEDMATQLYLPGDLCVSPRSFFEQMPSAEGIQTLNACVLYCIGQNELGEAYKQFPEFFFLVASYLQKCLINVEDILLAFRTLSVRGRYQWLIEKYPDSLNIIPQRFLAGYIGITVNMLKHEKNR